MHIRKFTRRLTPWLTLYLLVVSIGLPLQRVYCACIGSSEISLPGGEHDCGAHAAKALVETEKEPKASCCASAKQCNAPETADKKCGSSEIVVAALDADFLLETVGDYSIVPTAGLMPSWPAHLPLAAQVVAKTRPIRGPDPPDRRSGRDLLVAHQTFLI